MKNLSIAVLLLASVAQSQLMANDGAKETDLSKVLIIGDSISIGYTPYVAQILKDKAIVKHNPGNGGPTMRGVAYIDAWLGSTKWDVIHFNWGLWDMYGWHYENHDRSPKEYEKRLEVLVLRLKKTGAHLIWATTTPACPEAERKSRVTITPETEGKYLDAAMRVMKRHNIHVNDLHSFMKDKRSKHARADDNVHYTQEGKAKLAEEVARTIEKNIESKPKNAEAAKKAPAARPGVPTPTMADVPYGKHERHILDFWQAKSDTPTPVVFIIHGGGWTAGSKARANRFADIQTLLREGISVAAINYRLIKKHTQDVTPPVKAPLHDAARALQFVRSKAGEWNIEKERIGAAGTSAGACSSLWLVYHDDLADPQSKDPVARESTRLWCAGVSGAQTTLDPRQMKEWIPNASYGGHAFGKENFAQFLAERESILPWIAEYSPCALVSAGDPPVCLFYRKKPPVMGVPSDAIHGANFGIGLQQRCTELGVDCEVVYPGAPNVKYRTPTDYLIATLRAPAGASRR